MDPPARTPTTDLRLTDVVRAGGGWPVDWQVVATILQAADALLPEGRGARRPLTSEEVAALTLVASGLRADSASARVDFARAGDSAGFRALAGAIGVPREGVTALWAGDATAHLGLGPEGGSVTALPE